MHARSVRFAGNDAFELDALVLIPHLTEPMPNISAQNKRVISRFAALALISNKGGEGDRGEFYLFVGHLR